MKESRKARKARLERERRDAMHSSNAPSPKVLQTGPVPTATTSHVRAAVKSVRAQWPATPSISQPTNELRGHMDEVRINTGYRRSIESGKDPIPTHRSFWQRFGDWFTSVFGRSTHASR